MRKLRIIPCGIFACDLHRVRIACRIASRRFPISASVHPITRFLAARAVAFSAAPHQDPGMNRIPLALSLTALFASCGIEHPEGRQPMPPQQSRPKLLALDHSRPLSQPWMVIEGRKVNVVPTGAYAPGVIGAVLRVTGAGSLTGQAIVDLPEGIWACPGDSNMKAPVVRLIGTAGKPLNWERLPVTISTAVIRKQDGSTLEVPTHGWLVDPDDETNGIRCALEAPDVASPVKPTPTVRVEKGKKVIVFLQSRIELP